MDSKEGQRQFMSYQHTFVRHKTRVVVVGGVAIGGDNPIRVQSMTTPDTHLVAEVVAQILKLEEAGCELVRVTVPKAEDAAALGEIRKQIHIPLICDIHFDHKMALAAIDHPVDKTESTRGTWVAWTNSAKSSAKQKQRYPHADRRQCRQPRAGTCRKIWLSLPPPWWKAFYDT